MATTQNSDSFSEDLNALKDQNAALRRQVEQLQAERDSYRRTLQSWAKETMTEEIVQGWMLEEKVQGTLPDFINEVRDDV